MKIRIIKGLYGLRTGNHRVRVIHGGEECQVPKAEAYRLTALGVAVLMEDGADEESPQESLDLDTMTKAELLAYAEDLGLDASQCKTKAEIRQLVEELAAESPELGAEVPQV